MWQKDYQTAVKKIWLTTAAYTVIFQLAAVVGGVVALMWNPHLKIEQSGSPYFFAVAAGLFVILITSSPRKRHGFFQTGPAQMSWQTFAALVSLIIVVQVIFMAYSSGLESLLNHFHLTAFDELEAASAGSETWTMFIYSGLLAPVAEEIVFRGFVLRSLQPYGTTAAIVLSAYLFGLYHLNLMQTPFAMMLGIILAMVALKYGIKWSMALHAFNNMVLGDGLEWVLNALPKLFASGLTGLIFGGGSVVGLWLIWQKRALIKKWYRDQRLKRTEFKMLFINWSSILLTIVALVIMISELSKK